MPQPNVTTGLQEVACDLDELLGELRDSLTHGPIGVRREVDVVLRDLELLPDDLREEANSIEDAVELLVSEEADQAVAAQ